MRLVIVVLLAGAIVFLGVNVWSFAGRSAAAERTFAEIETRLAKAEADKRLLEADADYYTNPTNLEKELRARFNYRAPGETMIVIVPTKPTTTPKP
ncbi:MAG: hypothetical protein AAB759_00455 [Patescibacteria group bacterium]